MAHPEKFYQNILEHLFDGVYFVDTERRIRYWNKGAEQISGYAREDVIGKPCFEQILRHTNDKGELLCKTGCPLLSVMQDGQPQEVEIYLHHKDGYRVPVRVRAQAILDDNGKIIGAVEVFSDNSVFVVARQRMRELQHAADQDSLTSLG
ncbi:MAG: PAS domain-containing protein, partial [Anaerolineales bacterium]|nr:PAS domain-containing protein [Anaerolineales bacterium]